ncbi:PASTA domain-containing protein [Candidatus Aerophobetes bacterium]|nr:PASTA domain-containing protein [Candidatus Aerophobetes bacterium]
MSEWVKWFFKMGGFFFALLATAGVAAYITVVVLVPGESVVVPEVVGSRIEEAIFLLSERNLSVKVIERKFSRGVPENIIISQSPPPGTKVRENRSVELVLSGGAEVVIAPELVGMKLREAKIYLSELGVNVANISYVPFETFQDEVIAQDPSAGFKMTREEGINLLVSAGPSKPQLIMPDFKGRKIKEVAELLKGLSIDVAMIKEEFSLREEGTIISQSPQEGSIIDQDSGIELVVSRREEERIRTLSPRRWLLTEVQVPLGFSGKKVLVVISDEEGRRSLDYGIHAPGEKVWISCEVAGKGEVKIYLDDELVKIEKMEW